MRTPVLFIAISCLIGCNGEPTSAPQASGTSAGYVAQLERLPEGQLRGVLYRAIVDGGGSCPKVASFKRVPDERGKAQWALRCVGGQGWVVAIDNAGNASALGSTLSGPVSVGAN